MRHANFDCRDDYYNFFFFIRLKYYYSNSYDSHKEKKN